ncbi:hypothetical protein D7Z54_33495 [Salibacterium salarium]|uniref:Uncharacterized protein n=1 Tax=Salibacterium salarium TaxID=284579 RepID=A0A428MS65_9BACI|nr:hypothetical protein [Salibacterium salarium]RSL29013.1 hypothetical protein D7Z54_33495 [Salibacterium salarium]
MRIDKKKLICCCFTLTIGMMEIKNINIGLIFLLVSAIIYGSTLISTSIYSSILADTSWDSRYGLFGTVDGDTPVKLIDGETEEVALETTYENFTNKKSNLIEQHLTD